MADWKPIKRAGKAEVLDIHPQDPGRLDVVIGPDLRLTGSSVKGSVVRLGLPRIGFP